MPDTARPRVRLPAILQDRYRLGSPIGRGGASTVLRAHDELLGRDVAVKVFTTRAIEPDDLRRQEAEARMLAAMNHPALVTLLDAGIDLTFPEFPQVYLVLEMVEGLDLRTRLQTGPLAPIDNGYLGFDLTGALAYVHRHGIIHRDVKPANVLLADRAGHRLHGKLADFGIALLRSSAARPEEQTTGTAAYLSPEQVEGAPLTPATDVYSLGLVLLEAFTGRPAYTGTVLEAALGRLEREPEIPPSVPAPVARLIRAMTARRPADRPEPAELEIGFRTFIVGLLDGGGPRPPMAEATRIAALHRYDLLDSPPDGGFDRITALAARSLDVPVAVVGLADSDRLWFKSRVGVRCSQLALPIADAPGGGLLPRTTVLADGSLPRVAGEAGLASVAAVPLVTADGANLGVLAVGDRERRSFDARDLAMLEDLAALVVHEMELRLAVRRAVRLGIR